MIPITDAAGKTLQGITAEDLGDKIGVNGMQNGSLSFNKFPVPKACLLNKQVDVTEEGKFTAEAGDLEERVGKSLDRIVYWQISISSSIIGIVKAALYTGVTFSRNRWNLSENSRIQYPLFSFQMQQRALVPLLARALALNLMLNLARSMYVENSQSEMTSIIGNLCKVRITDFGLHAVMVVSESVGALGLSSYNRLNEYLSTARTAISWAGDNKVLTMKVGRQLLEALKENRVALPTLSATPKITNTSEL